MASTFQSTNYSTTKLESKRAPGVNVTVFNRCENYYQKACQEQPRSLTSRIVPRTFLVQTKVCSISPTVNFSLVKTGRHHFIQVPLSFNVTLFPRLLLKTQLSTHIT